MTQKKKARNYQTLHFTQKLKKSKDRNSFSLKKTCKRSRHELFLTIRDCFKKCSHMNEHEIFVNELTKLCFLGSNLRLYLCVDQTNLDYP